MDLILGVGIAVAVGVLDLSDSWGELDGDWDSVTGQLRYEGVLLLLGFILHGSELTIVGGRNGLGLSENWRLGFTFGVFNGCTVRVSSDESVDILWLAFFVG